MHQWWRIAFRLQNPRLKSTLVYPHLVNFEGDEYHTATSKSLKEDEELLKAGFEYVTEREGVKIYKAQMSLSCLGKTRKQVTSYLNIARVETFAP